jgi:hypothetical protein
VPISYRVRSHLPAKLEEGFNEAAEAASLYARTVDIWNIELRIVEQRKMCVMKGKVVELKGGTHSIQ